MDQTVFRARLSVAWPIWAGGYPSVEQALAAMRGLDEMLVVEMERHLPEVVGPRSVVSEASIAGGSHRSIAGLWPSAHPPNSMDVFLAVSEASGPTREPVDIQDARVDQLLQDIEGVLSSYCRSYMPGAPAGANLYDIESSWEPGPAMLSTGAGEVIAEVGSGSAAPPSISEPRTRVFISYSHRDSRWLSRLQVHLLPLSREFGMDIWDDTRIRPGADWREAISAALATARVAILLVSADFLASEFIAENELPPLLDAAEKDGMVVLPVIVGASMFQQLPMLSRFQAVNDPERPLVNLSKGKRESELARVALAVMDHFRSR